MFSHPGSTPPQKKENIKHLSIPTTTQQLHTAQCRNIYKYMYYQQSTPYLLEFWSDKNIF